MSIEKETNAYTGEIVGGLIRESSFYKSKSSAQEAEIHGLNLEIEGYKQILKNAGLLEPKEAYINQDHVTE